MKRLGIVILLLTGLSACAQQAPQTQHSMHWDEFSMQTKVAKVNHIKSLISPGFY